MARYGVKEVCDVTVFDLSTSKPVLYLDTLKMTNLENTADTTDARGGKGNAKLLSWDYNRDATMQIQDALMSPKSLQLLAGASSVATTANVRKREVITATSASVTVSIAPTTGTVTVYKGSDVQDGGTEVTGVTVSTTSISGGTPAIANGDKLYIYYEAVVSTGVSQITIKSDTFPGYYKIVGDTVVRNSATGANESFQLVIPKAKIQPAFTMNFQADGDPSVFDMNVTVFKQDTNTDMIYLIKY